MDSGILGILIAMALLAAAVFFLVGALVRWSRRLAWRGLAALGLAFVAAIGGGRSVRPGSAARDRPGGRAGGRAGDPDRGPAADPAPARLRRGHLPRACNARARSSASRNTRRAGPTVGSG